MVRIVLEPGALIPWVTTQRFLEIFALGGLNDLPDPETLADAGATESTTTSRPRSTMHSG
jgi:hypothetical protein